jgi:transcriptional regulator with XRE-family HTH domain
MDTDEIKKAFGKRVKELRKQHGWTQKDLAAKVDVRFSVLNKYESGIHVPPVDKLIELAEIFGTSVDYLLTGNELEETPLHNHRLLGRFKELQQLRAEDQETAIKLLDAMIIQRKLQDVVTSPIPRFAARP